MRVYRQRYTARDGKTRKASKYYVRFRDHVGVWRQVVASTDMAASEAVGRKLERLAALKSAGEPIDSALAKWVDGLSADLYEKLIGWGILDRRASMALLPLEDHLVDWQASLVNKANTQEHVDLVTVRARRVIESRRIITSSPCSTRRLARSMASSETWVCSSAGRSKVE